MLYIVSPTKTLAECYMSQCGHHPKDCCLLYRPDAVRGRGFRDEDDLVILGTDLFSSEAREHWYYTLMPAIASVGDHEHRGQLAERLNALVLKTSGPDEGPRGSNP